MARKIILGIALLVTVAFAIWFHYPTKAEASFVCQEGYTLKPFRVRPYLRCVADPVVEEPVCEEPIEEEPVEEEPVEEEPVEETPAPVASTRKIGQGYVFCTADKTTFCRQPFIPTASSGNTDTMATIWELMREIELLIQRLSAKG